MSDKLYGLGDDDTLNVQDRFANDLADGGAGTNDTCTVDVGTDVTKNCP